MRQRQSRHNPEKRAQRLARKKEGAQSYRTTVFAIVAASTTWRTARDIGIQANLTYPQTIFALYALHNNDRIARIGHKFTAQWGPLSLINEPVNNFELLEQLFHGIVNN